MAGDILDRPFVPLEPAALQAENERLKAEVLVLREQLQRETDRSEQQRETLLQQVKVEVDRGSQFVAQIEAVQAERDAAVEKARETAATLEEAHTRVRQLQDSLASSQRELGEAQQALLREERSYAAMVKLLSLSQGRLRELEQAFGSLAVPAHARPPAGGGYDAAGGVGRGVFRHVLSLSPHELGGLRGEQRLQTLDRAVSTVEAWFGTPQSPTLAPSPTTPQDEPIEAAPSSSSPVRRARAAAPTPVRIETRRVHNGYSYQDLPISPTRGPKPPPLPLEPPPSVEGEDSLVISNEITLSSDKANRDHEIKLSVEVTQDTDLRPGGGSPLPLPVLASPPAPPRNASHSLALLGKPRPRAGSPEPRRAASQHCFSPPRAPPAGRETPWRGGLSGADYLELQPALPIACSCVPPGMALRGAVSSPALPTLRGGARGVGAGAGAGGAADGVHLFSCSADRAPPAPHSFAPRKLLSARADVQAEQGLVRMPSRASQETYSDARFRPFV